MTPAKMFQNFGDNETPIFQVHDNVLTPCGLSKIKGVFVRGLSWWYETTAGTFRTKTIHDLNKHQ